MADHHDHEHDIKIVNTIGGFLGAGKTTLLNHILTDWDKGRTDVLVREYGAMAVDDQLLKNVSGNLHIFSGITVHDDPQMVLHDFLHDLYGKQLEKPFDHLLMEASGLDRPEWLVQLFMVGHMPLHYRLGSYIAIVDAEYGLLNLDEYKVAVHQVAYADVIILNKVDLADEQTIDRLEQRIHGINGIAKIHRASYCNVDVDEIMNIQLYDQLKDVQSMERSGEMQGIQTVSLVENQPLNKQKLNEWISDLFDREGSKMLRSKGFINFAGEDYRYEFQGVRKSFHSKAERTWQPDEERKTVIVLIGEGLPEQAELQESLHRCVE